jgi:hypothetical protein
MNQEIRAVCGQDYPHPELDEMGVRDGKRYSICTACEDEVVEIIHPEHARYDQDARRDASTVQDFLAWLRTQGYLVFKEVPFGLQGRGENDDDIHLAHRYVGVDYDALRAESAAILTGLLEKEGTDG